MKKLVTMTFLQLVFYLFLVITIVSSSPHRKIRSKIECAVCGTKTSKKCSIVANFLQDMRACFGQDFKETGVLCASCSRALRRHKKTGKTYEHVSTVLQFILQQMSTYFYHIILANL